MLVERGMPRKKALVAASRKMCHIIWSVWHNNKPFEVPIGSIRNSSK
ncbi:MAG: hypothetical protein M0Z77_04755 [Thermoplasmatales archaeon]|nr:hypothetical protein [Thermoplasmatales archaeon]